MPSILPAIANRWSPRAFMDKPIEADKLHRVFEAARLAASSNNEQPWRFLVGIKGQGESWNKSFAVLNEWNQKWNGHTPVLILTVAQKNFAKNGKPNAHAWHDTGAATTTLMLQAIAEGLHAHPMAGIHPDKAVELFNLPQDVEVVAVMALGYLGDSSILPEDMRASEVRRPRKPLEELVFTETWGKPLLS